MPARAQGRGARLPACPRRQVTAGLLLRRREPEDDVLGRAPVVLAISAHRPHLARRRPIVERGAGVGIGGHSRQEARPRERREGGRAAGHALRTGAARAPSRARRAAPRGPAPGEIGDHRARDLAQGDGRLVAADDVVGLGERHLHVVGNSVAEIPRVHAHRQGRGRLAAQPLSAAVPTSVIAFSQPAARARTSASMALSPVWRRVRVSGAENRCGCP